MCKGYHKFHFMFTIKFDHLKKIRHHIYLIYLLALLSILILGKYVPEYFNNFSRIEISKSPLKIPLKILLKKIIYSYVLINYSDNF